jgi:SAM-dependent methyltransferase
MKIKFTQDWLQDEWTDPEYFKMKEKNFQVLDDYLKNKPKNLLDIGCGLAWESRMFSDKYNTELFLLDGDVDFNKEKSSAADIGYHSSSNSFLFYNKLDTLNDNLFKLGTKNYHLIDCNNISIPDNVKFDVITSWLSCGFHYPINTYRDLILKHSHEATVIVFDIRLQLKTHEIFYPEDNIEIIHSLAKNRKRLTAHIKVK